MTNCWNDLENQVMMTWKYLKCGSLENPLNLIWDSRSQPLSSLSHNTRMSSLDLSIAQAKEYGLGLESDCFQCAVHLPHMFFFARAAFYPLSMDGKVLLVQTMEGAADKTSKQEGYGPWKSIPSKPPFCMENIWHDMTPDLITLSNLDGWKLWQNIQKHSRPSILHQGAKVPRCLWQTIRGGALSHAVLVGWLQEANAAVLYTLLSID